MDIFTLQNPHLQMRVTPQGAALLALETTTQQPILRPWQGERPFHPGESSLFPMLPLANRVAGNRFAQRGTTVNLPARPGDRDGFLHGNGWLTQWEVCDAKAHAITLQLRAKETCGFDYHAQITYTLAETRFIAQLVITHCGATPMLYGAGFHPFFAKTPQTQLQFSASGYWPEDERHLPLEWASVIPAALDFLAPSRPGAQWINNGYSGWNGVARLINDESAIILRSDTPWLMVYQTPQSEFICLEPQTHPVNAHHQPGQPGLRLLMAGEHLAFTLHIEALQHL